MALLDRYGDAAHLLAGGTALTLFQKQGLVSPGVLVDLGRIAGLDAVTVDDGGLAIGAMATLRAVETSADVARRVPALGAVVGRVATIRIRNQATLGGNLAHADPAQDPPPVLIVLDAEVEIAGPHGTRRIPVEQLFVDVFETSIGPGEVLTTVRVPAQARGARIGYEKFLPRTEDDYATVAVAARLTVGDGGCIADARLALGAAAAVPLRVPAAEALLVGAPIDEVPVRAVVEAVVATVDPVDDVRGSAHYKREMAGVWTARLLRRLASGEAAG